ncbi:MAG: hypothetical protein IKS51_08190 [Erysipelotrichaceae bacterium]|nr:hypothetical protein [Erysipelotrichaceae bacterium]
MKEKILEELKKRYTLTQKDMQGLQKIKKGTTNIDCDTYEIEGVGNLFLMNMKAMLGAMKMETYVITPFSKDLSFCNIDTVQAMGNDMCLFEMYKTSLHDEDLSVFEPIKEKYKDLPEYDGGEHWYDSVRLSSSIGKKGKKIMAEGNGMLEDCLIAYLDLLEKALDCDPEAKKEEVRKYVDRLIAEGGMAVDGLSKMIGKEETTKLIRDYMYNI